METFLTIIVIIIIMIIDRKKYKKEFNTNKTILVYGRRKTGKSFFVDNFVDYHKFLFIYRDKSIKDIKTNENWSYEELKRYLLENKNKKIVIDEFHRLGNSFLDFIHSNRLKNLILITSSLHIANNLLKTKNPLLGLIYAIKFDLIDTCDILKSFKIKNIYNKIEYLPFFKEPTLIDLYSSKNSFDDFLVKYFNFAKYWTSSLFGEIFEDEDRKLTITYEAILRAISLGKQTSGRISSYLYNNKVIDKENAGAITAYLSVLVDINIIDKIKDIKSKKYIYKISSAPIDFFFYIDSKYKSNISKKELTTAWKNKASFYIEDILSKILASNKGYSIVKYNFPNKEIDLVLKKFKKIKIIGSIKWKDIDKVDLSLVKKNLEIDLKNVKKYLFVRSKNKKEKSENITILDSKDIMKFCK